MKLIVKYLNGHMSELSGVYSAVMYQDETETGSGGASSVCGEQSLFPSINQQTAAFNTERKEGEGVEVGLGRIGGMGERKDRGEGEGGKEGEPALYSMRFLTLEGEVSAPVTVLAKLIDRYGMKTVTEELFGAQQWLIAKPGRKKKKRGLGMFLINWMIRADVYRRERRKLTQGNLLDEETTDQSW